MEERRSDGESPQQLEDKTQERNNKSGSITAIDLSAQHLTGGEEVKQEKGRGSQVSALILSLSTLK